MADGSSGGKPYWSDTEITVDRDGIPHYTGAVPALMKEYTRRVRFAFGGLEVKERMLKLRRLTFLRSNADLDVG